MGDRTESLTILLSEKEKDFIVKNATDKCLSVQDYILLSVLSVDFMKFKDRNLRSRNTIKRSEKCNNEN